MRKIKPRIAVKFIVVLLCLFFVYILQATVFCRVYIFGAKPLLLPLAVTVIAVFEGSIKGGIFGIIAGMLCDLSFNQPAVQFTIILTLIGLAVGYLSDTLIIKGFPSYFLCSLGALVVCAFCQMFSFLVFDGVAFGILIGTGLRQTLASIIFTIPIYYIARSVNRVL